MQALYRAEVAGNEAGEARRELAGANLPEEVRDHALHLFDQVVSHRSRIDAVLVEALTRWDLKRVAIVEACVLRIGAAELLFEPEVPARVVLDEAIEIAKEFGSGESGRFVNGVLDRVSREHRGEETV
jgi:N utilization substance protein B